MNNNFIYSYRKETIDGILFKIIKSGIQKDIRLGDTNSAIENVMTFSKIFENKPNEKSEEDKDKKELSCYKRIITNYLNRFKIISVEDLFDEYAPFIVNKEIEEFEKDKDIKRLIKIVIYLCECKKIRIWSYIKRINENKEMKKYFNNLENSKSESFLKIMKDCEKILKVKKIDENIKILISWYKKLKKNKEGKLFLYTAYAFHEFKKEFNLKKIEEINKDIDKKIESLDLKNIKKMTIKDYYLDKHTGIKKEEGILKFIEIGSNIKNENNEFYRPILKDFYNACCYIENGLFDTDYLYCSNRSKLLNLNKLIDKKLFNKNEVNKFKDLIFNLKIPVKMDYELKEGFQIEKLPLGQKRTGKSKRFVYIDKEFVYKGPFQIDEIGLKRELLFSNIIKGSLPVDFIIVKNDFKIYFAKKNVGNIKILDDESSFEICNSKIDNNIKVIKNELLIKRFKSLKDKDKFMDVVVNLFYQYLIFKIGDVHFGNIICDNNGNNVYGIDYECERTDDNFNLNTLCGSKMSNNDKILIKKNLNKINKIEKIDNFIKKFDFINFEEINKRLKKVNNLIDNLKNDDIIKDEIDISLNDDKSTDIVEIEIDISLNDVNSSEGVKIKNSENIKKRKREKEKNCDEKKKKIRNV